MEENCPICLEQIENVYETECKHKFHESCIKEWKRKNSEGTCPICRSSINEIVIEMVNVPPRRLDFNPRQNIFINFRNIYIIDNMLNSPISSIKHKVAIFLVVCIVAVYAVGFVLNR